MKFAFSYAFFPLLISICSTDLTGLHYLHTFNCSSPDVYIPQGPYLFSQHWPFPSIIVKYNRQFNDGLCYRDGSLTFALNNNTRFCAGTYHHGQGRLFCQFENDKYCWINVQTSDGSQLTCDILA